ncbi:MAG: ion transporter [Prevotella sp.]|nr:ion transporter [Prevotella sp.]
MEKITDMRPILCNEHVILTAIILNTLVLFVGGFWRESLWFDLADTAFTLLFLAEAATKISYYGWKNYWARRWNRFDLIVLLIALPSVVSLFVEPTVETNAILAMRCTRLLKTFKMLRFIPNVHKLLKGIRLAIRASLIVFIAFVIFLVIFSILSFTLFSDVEPVFFGNPAISLYSIFRLFSVEGWYELPDAIARSGGPGWALFARLYFSIAVFLGGIIGMSLVNSIFVDAMAGDNNDEVMEKLKSIEEKLKKLSEENKSAG